MDRTLGCELRGSRVQISHRPLAMKYKAQGASGCTYGLEIETEYYIQIQHPTGEFGSVHELAEGGQFGWDWWINKYEPIGVDEFPDGCALSELVE